MGLCLTWTTYVADDRLLMMTTLYVTVPLSEVIRSAK